MLQVNFDIAECVQNIESALKEGTIPNGEKQLMQAVVRKLEPTMDYSDLYLTINALAYEYCGQMSPPVDYEIARDLLIRRVLYESLFETLSETEQERFLAYEKDRASFFKILGRSRC